MRPYRRYLLLFGAVAALQLAIVGSFNLVSDPFDLWSMPRIAGLNDQKPGESDDDMRAKAVGIVRVQPRTVLLGTSRVDLGLDPAHPALQPLGPVYNAAVVGGNMHVIRRYFDHWIATTADPKRAVIGLDFFAFNANLPPPPIFDEDRLERRFVSLSDANLALFSRAALDASMRSFSASLTGSALSQVRADGLLTDTDMERLARARGMDDRIAVSVALYLNGADRFANFTISEAAIDDLRAIVEESRRRKIDLRLFVPPEHVLLTEALVQRGLMCAFLDWKKRVAEIAPYWDFSGYNAITTEPVGRSMKYYWDASHFRASVGNWILSRMFGSEDASLPDQFGFHVTAASEPGWREVTIMQERTWEQSHGDGLRWLAAIANPPLPGGAVANTGCRDETSLQAALGHTSRP